MVIPYVTIKPFVGAGSLPKGSGADKMNKKTEEAIEKAEEVQKGAIEELCKKDPELMAESAKETLEKVDNAFRSAKNIPTPITFDAFLSEDLTVELDEEELEKIGVEPGEMVAVTITKIPDQGGGES